MNLLKSGKIKFLIISLLIIVSYLGLARGFVLLDKAQDLDRLTSYSFPIHGDDSMQYFELAKELKTNQSFSRPETPNVPETFRVPGYPIFIALVMTIFGSMWAVVLLQIIMVVISTFLVFRISKRILPRKWSWFPAILFAFDPAVIFSGLTLMSEIIYVLLLLIIADLLTLERRLKWAEYSVIGLVLGVMVLIRPVGIFLPFIVLAILLIKDWKISGKSWRKESFLNSIALLVLFVIAISPWLVRNKIETGVLGISSISGFNLLYYNASGFLHHIGQDERGDNLAQELGLNNLTEEMDIRNASAEQSLALKIILSQPISYGIFHLEGVAHFLLGSSLSSFVDYYTLPIKEWYGSVMNKFSGRTINIFITLERLFRLLGILLIPFAFIKRETHALAWILIVIGLYFALLTGPVSLPRYRVPAEPFLFILAMAGLMELKKKIYERS